MKKNEFKFIDDLSDKDIGKYSKNCFYLFMNPNFSYDMEYMINDNIYGNSLIRYLKDLYIRNYASKSELNYYNEYNINKFKKSNEYKNMQKFFISFINSENPENVLKDYALKNNISKAVARIHLNYYATNYALINEKEKYNSILGIKKEKYSIKQKSMIAFNSIINQNLSIDELRKIADKLNTSVDNLFSYCESYILNEKKEFLNDYLDIVSEIKNKKKDIREEIISSKNKYAFDICINTKFDEAKITKFRKLLGLKKNSSFINYAKIYADKYATDVERKIFYDLYRKRNVNINIKNGINIEVTASYEEVFDNLIKLKNIKDRKEYLDSLESIKVYELRHKINDYVRRKEIKKESTKNIGKKIELYLEEYFFKKLAENQEQRERNINSKEKEKLIEGRKLICSFVKSNCLTIDEYCKKNNYDKNRFAQLIKTVKKCDEETYQMYDNYKNNKILLSSELFNDEIEKIINGIKFGIKEEDEIREFNILDYYKIINMNPDLFKQISNTVLSRSDYLELVKFFAKNNIKQEFIMNQEINGQTIIKGKEIPKDVKTKAIKYMINNNIPMYRNIYRLVLDEIISENDIEKNKSR